MVIVAILLVIGFLYLLSSYTAHGESVTVPDLRGQKVGLGRSQLEALGLRAVVSDTGYVDAYVGDVVLEQSYRPGAKVKAGRVVELTVNASSARAIAVPVLADNSSRREAEAKLRAIGFRNILIEPIPGDQDWVYNVQVNGREVQPGERVPVTTTITLVVGDGIIDDEYNGNDSLDYGLYPVYSDESGAAEGTESVVSDTESMEAFL